MAVDTKMFKKIKSAKHSSGFLMFWGCFSWLKAQEIFLQTSLILVVGVLIMLAVVYDRRCRTSAQNTAPLIEFKYVSEM